MPATRPLPTETLLECLSFRLQRKVLFLPGAGELVVNEFPQRDPALPSQFASGVRLSHRLIDAVHIAFSQHRPLVLSPDAIWMVIAQGFGHHVAANAEELRGTLVRHPGKKELAVKASELSVRGFSSTVAELSECIKRETDPVLHETLICDFSTTSAVVRTASEVALMDSFSSYFTYAMMCVCGIPTITIEGTPEDWRRVRARVEVLATYGLEWWVSRLRPILDEFVLAAEGRPNLEFWKAIYKPKAAYAVDMVTGWIADLFPYLGDPPERRRNSLLTHSHRDWSEPVEYAGPRYPAFDMKKDLGVSRKQFPSGLSSVALRVVFPDETEAGVSLLGGFMAVKQDGGNLAVSPLISWCVAEPAPAKPVMVV